MKDKVTWSHIAEYFAGELTSSETKEIESWIKSSPKREKQLKKLYQVWKESQFPPYQLDEESSWEKLQHSISAAEELEQSSGGFEAASGDGSRGGNNLRLHGSHARSAKKFTKNNSVLLVAASILVVGILISIFVFMNDHSDMDEGTGFSEIVVRDGEKATYSLKDGSRIVMHAGSRLKVPDDYYDNDRQLFLEGEAYFEVSHDPDKPFVVYSHNSYTRVVGTHFLMQAWPESAKQVIVSQGKVLFGERRLEVGSTEHEGTLVSENQLGVLTEDQILLTEDVEDMNVYLGWMEGRILFHDRPLKDLLTQLERWYSIELIVENEHIGDKNITAEIDLNNPVKTVLKAIAYSLNLEIEMTDRKAVFKMIGSEDYSL